jgi:cell division protein FtsB
MNETIVLDKHEGVWDRLYVEELESENNYLRNDNKNLEQELRKLKQTLFALSKDVIA